MKNITSAIVLILLLATASLTNAQWSQIGNDIDGEAAGDYSGGSVSLSSDGSIVAIGAPYNDGNGTDAGHVRIYENIGGNWVQLGNDIDGEDAEDESGVSVNLSSDGSILAIGARENDGNGNSAGHVRIYEFISGNWIQMGSDINGESAGDDSGFGVSLSSNGSIVAIGAYGNDGNGNNRGSVRAYEYSGGNWTQIGNDIDGEADGDCSCIVSLSSDGSILAIGAYQSNVNGNESGQVKVFEYNLGNWIQIGSSIDGEAAEDWSGVSVSLSSNGSIIAIGAPWNDGNDTTDTARGHTRIFEYIGGNWVQMGSDIDGEEVEDMFGFSVNLNSDGTIVAIGAPHYNGIGTDAGHVSVFGYSMGNWVQIGSVIYGEATGDASFSVNISSDGSIVAIGAPYNCGNGIEAGHVRVYGNPNVGIKENTINTEVSIYPNPTTGLITIKNEECRINNASVFDIYGKEVFNTDVKSQKTKIKNQKCEIDLSSNAKGIYFIKVTTNKGVAVKKVVLE